MIPFNKPYLSGNETKYIEQQVASNSKISKKEILQMSFLFIFLFLVYSYLAFFAKGDMSDHAFYARKMSEGIKSFQGNFIFYGLINILSSIFSVFSSISSLPAVSKISLTFFLAAATAYKFRWTYTNLPKNDAEWKHFLMALSLIFVFAIPVSGIFGSGLWQLGNFAPTVWHNSTTIFLFPFAIALFAVSIKQIEIFCNRRNWWILLLVFLNIFIKPSYFFVWVCVYPLFLLIKYGLTANFFKGLIPVLLGVVFLFAQYFWIYFISDYAKSSESSVIIKPFAEYSYYTPAFMIPWALLFSLLFPVLYLILNFKRLCKERVFLFVYAGLFVAVCIYMLLFESGSREGHGNFYWQTVICAWLCFYVSLADLLKNKRQLMQNENLKTKLLLTIYVLHVIAGVAYLGRYIFTGIFA